ncbi:Aste57867_210 [Aphanomyces stellatus]|uniref:Aste57867_210 protein n=1 Tax=Aphanomyces stellatus TaxID=120398 RepID=A0A485K4K2_9STRA|nr:hypothetical protein As57867_000210 [Aphanomyces stellatus]VFT77436.1 Aste57867_210 [Aphanomyces stellatus]
MSSPLHEISAAYSPVGETTPLFPAPASAGGVLPRGTCLSSYAALMSSMVGAGILALPASVAAVHLVPWLVLLAGTCGLASASLTCLTVACDVTGEFSYEGLCARLCGRWTAALLRSLTLVALFGGGVMFTIIAVDMLLPFCASYLSRPLLAALFSLAAFPLCLPKSLYVLTLPNVMVVLSAVYIAVVLCLRAQDERSWPSNAIDDEDDTSLVTLLFPPWRWRTLLGLAATIPVQTLCFSCPFNFVRSYGELATKDTMAPVTHWLLVSGFVIYVVAAVAGFWCFRGHPPSDILTGFDASDTAINSVRLALAVSMLFKVPMVFQPFRETLQVSWPDHTHSCAFHVLLALVCAYLSGGCAVTLIADDLTVLMAAVGTVAGIVLSYIVPGYLLWRTTATSLWLPDRIYYQHVAVATITISSLLLVVVAAVPFLDDV